MGIAFQCHFFVTECPQIQQENAKTALIFERL
jgi:hypothetical protein